MLYRCFNGGKSNGSIRQTKRGRTRKTKRTNFFYCAAVISFTALTRLLILLYPLDTFRIRLDITLKNTHYNNDFAIVFRRFTKCRNSSFIKIVFRATKSSDFTFVIIGVFVKYATHSCVVHRKQNRPRVLFANIAISVDRITTSCCTLTPRTRFNRIKGIN